MIPEDEWWSHWDDPGGPGPDDPGPEGPAGEPGDWQWDPDSLAIAKTVGYLLYLKLRDRLKSTGVPATEHNDIITELHNVYCINKLLGGDTPVTFVTDPDWPMGYLLVDQPPLA